MRESDELLPSAVGSIGKGWHGVEVGLTRLHGRS
jgi:hypothetical protein